MRIIFIPFIDAFGGAERLILDLSRYLHGNEIDHVIACFRQTIDLQAYADWPVRVHQLLPKRNPLSEARALQRFLSECDPTPGGNPLLFDLKSAFYSGMLSSKSFCLHLTDPPSLLPADLSKYAFSTRRLYGEEPEGNRASPAKAWRGEFVHKMNRRGLRRASQVFVMTEKVRSELKRLYEVDALVVRPGISSSQIVERTLTAEAAPIRMLSVSRLEPNKRIDWILRALAGIEAQAVSKGVDWHFEVVGDGREIESLKRLAVDLGISDCVSFLGHVSDEQLDSAYSRANLFLMPAVQGYGLPALEALGRGIPTIVHKDSGVSEILTGSDWVEIVDGNNGSLANAIRVMLTRLKGHNLKNSRMLSLPRSLDWAEVICRGCGWLPESTN